MSFLSELQCTATSCKEVPRYTAVEYVALVPRVPEDEIARFREGLERALRIAAHSGMPSQTFILFADEPDPLLFANSMGAVIVPPTLCSWWLQACAWVRRRWTENDGDDKRRNGRMDVIRGHVIRFFSDEIARWSADSRVPVTECFDVEERGLRAYRFDWGEERAK